MRVDSRGFDDAEGGAGGGGAGARRRTPRPGRAAGILSGISNFGAQSETSVAGICGSGGKITLGGAGVTGVTDSRTLPCTSPGVTSSIANTSAHLGTGELKAFVSATGLGADARTDAFLLDKLTVITLPLGGNPVIGTINAVMTGDIVGQSSATLRLAVFDSIATFNSSGIFSSIDFDIQNIDTAATGFSLTATASLDLRVHPMFFLFAHLQTRTACGSSAPCPPTAFVDVSQTVDLSLDFPSGVVVNSNDGSGIFLQGDGQTIPEPATLALLGAGLAGLGFLRRRRSN